MLTLAPGNLVLGIAPLVFKSRKKSLMSRSVPFHFRSPEMVSTVLAYLYEVATAMVATVLVHPMLAVTLPVLRCPCALQELHGCLATHAGPNLLAFACCL